MVDRATAIHTRVNSDGEKVETDRIEVYVLSWTSSRPDYAIVSEVEGSGEAWFEPVRDLLYRGPAI